jgi:hypothetical protein
MDFLPPSQQQRLLFKNNPHRAADINTGHAINPNHLRSAIGTSQIELGMTITENVNMGRLMIVNKDDHTQPVSAKHSDHYDRQ